MDEKFSSNDLDAQKPESSSHASNISGQTHVPNHIPLKERIGNVLLSLFLFVYCTLGVLFDDIYIPSIRFKGEHLQGISMWLVYGAMLCAVVNLLSVVVDHYDVRANEVSYKQFARVTQALGWCLFLFGYLLA